jgi:malate permease and related proteins
MTNLFILVLCFSFGALANRFRLLPEGSHRVLNVWIINISLPALVLRSVHRVTLTPQLIWAASGIEIGFLCVALIAIVALKKKWASPAVIGALTLCAALPNTAFVGLPLIESLMGKEAVPQASMVDQLGSFLTFSLLAVPFAAWISGQGISFLQLLKRVITFPAFIALALGFLLRPVDFSDSIDNTLHRFQDMLSPLALASIGFQLKISSFKGRFNLLALGLSLKLLLIPVLVFLISLIWSPEHSQLSKIAVLQSAMSPMVTGGILANENGFDPDLSAGLIALGVLLSFITVPLWFWMMS